MTLAHSSQETPRLSGSRRLASLLLVDDHRLVARTLSRYLARQPGLGVRAVLPSAEAALSWLDRQPEGAAAVDLILLDLSLPAMDGFQFLELLADRYPALPCLILSGYHDANYVDRAFRSGARGYVFKENTSELLAAIRTVLAGGRYRPDGAG